MERQRRLHKRTTVSRVTSCVLCFALGALHPTPETTLYRCLVTGKVHQDCCCKVLVSCCDMEGQAPPACCEPPKAMDREAAPAEARLTTSRGSKTPSRETHSVQSTCVCCEVVPRDGFQPPTLISSSNEEGSGERGSQTAPQPLDGRFAVLTPAAAKPRAPPRSPPSPPSTVPRYLLLESFLL